MVPECSKVLEIVEYIKKLSEWDIVEVLQKEGVFHPPEPLCEDGRLIRIRRTKYKCIPCGKEISPRKFSMLKNTRLPYWKIYAAYMLFKNGTSADSMARVLNISRLTSQKILGVFKVLSEKSYLEVPQHNL